MIKKFELCVKSGHAKKYQKDKTPVTSSTWREIKSTGAQYGIRGMILTHQTHSASTERRKSTMLCGAVCIKH
jgi:hypothetical protein